MGLDILVEFGFQMDIYCNRKTRTGLGNLGMSKWRGRFILLSLLVTLLLIEDRILLPPLLQWHAADLSSPSSPPQGLLLQSCFAESEPQTVLWPRVSPPQMQTCACFCWTWWGSCQPLSPACWHTSETSVTLTISLHSAFFIYHLIHSSSLYLTNLTIRKLWDIVLKAKCTSSKAPPLCSVSLTSSWKAVGLVSMICTW